ncbi:uncharacterized protein LOC132554678, partial [Ylistrum balloti]|uniref:uncharacterized protein LOC132554678 n=1 Tax=Ylistrum balloti TaxID=509963 RepID=UPI002905A0CD
MKEITKKLGAMTDVVPTLSVSFPERTETEQLKITYDELNETKEKSCDEPNRCEKWTTDSIDAESAWDGGCQEMGGLLASKSEWIVNDEEELQIEAENFFRPERCTYLNKVVKRLETFLPVCSGIDCDSLADAGFYYTGENIRCFTCGVVIIFGPCTDDYWAEHAKTSPGCSYVRTQKGAAYIHHLLSTE